jgi:hypothetical protein
VEQNGQFSQAMVLFFQVLFVVKLFIQLMGSKGARLDSELS